MLSSSMKLGPDQSKEGTEIPDYFCICVDIYTWALINQKRAMKSQIIFVSV